MTDYQNSNDTLTTIVYNNDSSSIPSIEDESSLDDVCKNFHVSIFG